MELGFAIAIAVADGRPVDNIGWMPDVDSVKFVVYLTLVLVGSVHWISKVLVLSPVDDRTLDD